MNADEDIRVIAVWSFAWTAWPKYARKFTVLQANGTKLTFGSYLWDDMEPLFKKHMGL